MRFSEKSFQIFRRDILILITQLVSGAIIARVLGPSAMGLWVILLMIPGYAEVVARPHADSASVYFLGRGKYRLGEVSFALIVISLVTSGIYVLAFLWQQDRLFSSFLSEAADVKSYVYLILASVPIRLIVLNYNYLLVSREDITGYNIVLTLFRLVPSLLGAVLVLTTDLDILGLIIAFFAGGVSAVTYGVFRVHRVERMIFHRNIRLGADLLAYGFKLYLLVGIGYLHLYVSGLLVVWYFSSQEVAFFRLSQERALILARVSGAVGALLYPRVVHISGQGDGSQLFTAVSFRRTLLVLVVLGALGALLAKPGIAVLYGSEYSAMLLPLLIFIPAIIAEASSALFNQYFIGIKRLAPVFAVTIISLGIQLGFLWFSVLRWGVVGAATAVLAAYLITMCLRIWVFSKLEGVPVRELLVPNRGDILSLTKLASTQIAQPVTSFAKRSRASVRR